MNRSRAVLRLEAPAKVNLYLHVLGRCDDGLHRLDSLIGFVEAHDLLEVRRAPALRLRAEGPFAGALPEDDANLAIRAARMLRDRAGVDAGAVLRLRKNLPVAAGLGGGSADAAATLRALVRLWELDVEAAELRRLGAGLGADLPACLMGTALYAGGTGEEVESAPPLPPVSVLLVNPGVALSTAAVYDVRAGAFSPPGPRAGFPDARALARGLAHTRNDLTQAACGMSGVVARALTALETCAGCLLARLSGSGATCFGLFETEAAAERARRRVAAAEPGWWVVSTRFRRAPAEIAALTPSNDEEEAK